MKQRHFWVSCAMAGLSLALGATSSRATVLASEDFSYGGTSESPAELIGQGGGTGWTTDQKNSTGINAWVLDNGTSTGTSNIKVIDDQSTVPTTATNSATIYRYLATPLADVAGNTYYISFDAQALVANNRFFGLQLEAADGVNKRMLIGSGSTYTTWTIDRMDLGTSASVAVDSGVDISNHSTLLVKIVMGGAGASEMVTFWVDPNLNAGEDATSAVTGQANPTYLDWGDIGRLRLGGGNTSGGNDFAPFTLDNILITDSSPFAHAGDANGDGMVNLADLQILGDNWQSTTADWSQADFTGDGTVNLADLQILGDNWNYGVSSDLSFDQALAGIVIPEPTTVGLLGVGGLLLLLRSRKC